MKCQLCGRQIDEVYKVIKQIKIYECLQCQLGFIDQNALTRTQLSQKKYKQTL